jgi:hypothetical protein
MVDRIYPPAPVSPYERTQAELIRAYNENRRLIDEREAKNREANIKVLDPRIEFQHEIVDENVRQLAAIALNRTLAERNAQPHHLSSYEVSKAIEQAKVDAFRLERGQQLEAEQAQIVQKQQEQEEKLAREHEAARQEPIPGAVERFNATLEASRAEKQLLDSAKTLSGDRDDLAAQSWVAQAATPERLQRQFGRYNELRNLPPPDPPGAGDQTRPRPLRDPGPDDDPSPSGGPPALPRTGPDRAGASDQAATMSNNSNWRAAARALLDESYQRRDASINGANETVSLHRDAEAGDEQTRTRHEPARGIDTNSPEWRAWARQLINDSYQRGGRADNEQSPSLDRGHTQAGEGRGYAVEGEQPKTTDPEWRATAREILQASKERPERSRDRLDRLDDQKSDDGKLNLRQNLKMGGPSQ